LVLWFARDPSLFHALGIFAATFIYALFTLAWVDREPSGQVPLLSSLLVGVLLVASMLMFSRLVQRLTDLQVTSVLQLIGDRGREVIQEMFARTDDAGNARRRDGKTVENLGPVTQTLRYSGEPRAIARLDINALAQEARESNAVIVMACAVGDTLVEDTLLLHVHGGERRLSERQLMRAIRLERERTFEQDPKYPLRLLVDVAIKALSPAINDPTTAVQAIDEIEDLLRRLGRRDLDTGHIWDANAALRLVLPMPTWEDYLALAFDEIRQYGATSVQVMRRLRAALVGLIETLPDKQRTDAVRKYLAHLDLAIERSPLDAEDRMTARQEDRQGLGLSGRRGED
jgi:uncharacterized membrane protein